VIAVSFGKPLSPFSKPGPQSFRARPFAQERNEIRLGDWLIANRLPAFERRRNSVDLSQDIRLGPLLPGVVVRVVALLLHLDEGMNNGVQALGYDQFPAATLNWGHPELLSELGRVFDHGRMKSASEGKRSALNAEFGKNPPPSLRQA